MKTLIIYEAGVNHNGDIARALQMVREAKRIGADVVKFQTFRAEELVTADAPKAEYQKVNDSAPSQLAMLKALELSDDDYRLLMEECKRIGIEFMSTPFSISSAELLSDLGMKRWKIPSGELTNLPLLRFIAKTANEIIMSTGMATLKEVEEAVDVLITAGLPKSKIHLMHCTTAYPTQLDDVNLHAMDVLATLGVASVGYSDHTDSLAVPVAAVAMGATMIEKHFTLDRNLPGPDHRASLEPNDFARMVSLIRDTERVLGQTVKKPTAAETPNIAVARKSIVAATNISKGDTFDAQNLTTKRPGDGISPMMWDSMIGRKAKYDYYTDQKIKPDELT